jgi:hypothetical protein
MLCLIYFDIEKAYDTTLKYDSLKDLYDIGLKGNLPRCTSNFLSEREIKVRVNSTYLPSTRSILSVTLFSINSLVKALNDNIKVLFDS